MSLEGHPNAGSEFDNLSSIRPYTDIPNSDSLEDGEIVEGQISSIASQRLSRLLHSSNRVSAATPPFPRAAGLVISPVPTLAPTVEPMTKEDLGRAKLLVLDLLGWGVTPEYLVECGLPPDAVYKILTDLQFCLPSDLEALFQPTAHHDAR